MKILKTPLAFLLCAALCFPMWSVAVAAKSDPLPEVVADSGADEPPSGEEIPLIPLVPATPSDAEEVGVDVSPANTGAVLTPTQGWNYRVAMQAPGGSPFLTDNMRIPAYDDAAKQNGYISLTLGWPEELPDCSAPGTYWLEAAVLTSDLPALVGEPLFLEVFVGDVLAPRLSPPVLYFDAEGAVDTLQFFMPFGVGGANTQLWYSADDGQSWSLGAASCFLSAALDAALFEPERAYLLALRADKDGTTDGVSPVWSLTLHEDGSYTFILTDKESPALAPPDRALSSWEEIISTMKDTGRLDYQYTVDCDLTVGKGDYVELQRWGWDGFGLDFGKNNITVEDGGWLILGMDDLRGEGAERPLITVESGGTLVLSGFNYYDPQYPQGIHATGNGTAGGVAVEVRDGGRLYAQQEPGIYAEGPGAVAIRSLSPGPFSLPVGMHLSVEGAGAAALETAGDTDVFYSELRAAGEDAAAVRAPAGAQVTLTSAAVSPVPEGAVARQGVFGGFNMDLSEPYRLWLGKLDGMYLSEVPLYAGITVPTAGGFDRVEAVLIDCLWEDENVDYTKAGSYKATARFGGLQGVPDALEVEVGILESGTKPDISVIHPLPLISVGGMPPAYGFTIWCNDRFSADISSLWCSTDDGESWQKSEESLSVFWFYEDMPAANAQITVAGLKPETPYLFRLDSVGGSASGLHVMGGASEVREVILHSDGKIINMDWSGDRDGGDAGGGRPEDGDTGQKPPTPDNGSGSESGGGSDGDREDHEESIPPPAIIPPHATPPPTTPESEIKPETTPTPEPPVQTTSPTETTPPAEPSPPQYQPPSQPDAPSVPAMAAPATEKSDDFVELFGETRDLISGTRLLMMVDSTKQARFSKQGVTVTFSADAVSDLGIQDSDRIAITIEKESADRFSFSLLVNDAPVTSLENTHVIMPYALQTPGAALSLRDAEEREVSKGSYDAAPAVASFTVNTTGRFSIVEELIEEESVPAPRAPKAPIWPAALIMAALLLAATLGFLLKRRPRP